MTNRYRLPREILALILLTLCTAHIVQTVLVKHGRRAESAFKFDPVAQKVAEYEQSGFTVIAKIAYAGHTYLGKLAQQNKEMLAAQNSFSQGFANSLSQPQGKKDLTQERLLIAHALSLHDSKKQICSELSKDESSKLCSDDVIKNRDVKLIDPWFELLARSIYEEDSGLALLAYNQAKEASIKIFGYVIVGIGVIFVSSCLLFSLVSKISRGKLDLAYSPNPEIGVELIEMFAVYLAAMLFLPYLLDYFEPLQNVEGSLFFNIVGISSLSLLYFWPRIKNAKATQQCFGLASTSFKSLVSDILAGPLAYVASISGLFVVVLVYSALLQFFQIDPSAGSHPIMPILAEGRGTNTFLLVILVAVVVAPLVEELFFRGALYGWLRTRFSAGAAIPISAMLFAVIHPQGALGFVPLSCIGVMLAFVREWRQSLIAPILAHACVNGVTLLLASAIL